MGSFTKKAPRKFWLVVSTPLKNNSQLGVLFPIYGKIKNVPNHQPEFHEILSDFASSHHFDFMGFNKTNWEI